DATLTLSSTSGTQTVAADDFFVGYYSTTRGHDELITEVTIPTPPDLSTGFAEFSRRSGDFAVALAVTATWTGTGRREARVVVGGLDVRPRRLLEIETLLSEGGSAAALAGTSRDHVQTATDPSSDIHASADHRISLGLEMVRRSLSRMEATP
ncbi:MAG: FAD binding domain-containing protein, partial [Gemmatimonadetes bacterium]|nr:FAD binding domain-containing protein [Gemmatimonadota bacterium]